MMNYCPNYFGKLTAPNGTLSLNFVMLNFIVVEKKHTADHQIIVHLSYSL